MTSERCANMVPLLPNQSNWPSAVGNFILNFGMLDLSVQDYLEDHLPTDEFAKMKARPFYERLQRIWSLSEQIEICVERREAIQEFLQRVEPLRQIRNHIAHGVPRISREPGHTSPVLTISLPRDLDGSAPANARHLSFTELQDASQNLVDLIEQLHQIMGIKTTMSLTVEIEAGTPPP